MLLIMLVSFSVTNYKTFRDRAEWSMIASADQTREADNVVAGPFGLRLLKSAVVYGANASGKSKLMDALFFFRQFVRSSSNTQIGTPIGVDPFRLNPRTATEPSEFEIQLVDDDTLYRYGFAATRERVTEEWLFIRRNKKEMEVFRREGQTIDYNAKYIKGTTAQLIRNDEVRTNALLISLAAQFNNPIATTIVYQLFFISVGLNATNGRRFTTNKLRDVIGKPALLAFFRSLDLPFKDILTGLTAASSLSVNGATPEEDMRVVYQMFSDAGEPDGDQAFSLRRDESTGTRKLFDLAGLLQLVLNEGLMWIVDELDTYLHPSLMTALIGLFNSKEHNPNNAQLLFNTHDTNLLSCGHFRRDQIWFTERDRHGAATLYSLSDIKTPAGRQERGTADFERNYLQGRYGAIPFLGDLASLPTVPPAPADGPQA